MAWVDNLKTCTYTAPSGSVFTLQYEDLSLSARKKTTVFEFAGSNNVHVQDNGVGVVSYPMVVYFSGETHDTEANEFFTALSETGAGQLQHPLYGLVTVVPTGDIKRSDKVKTEANQSAYEVKFVESNPNLYPSAQVNQKSNALSASSQFDADIATEFSDAVSIETESERQGLIEEFTDYLGSFKEDLDSLAQDQTEVQSDIDDIFESINGGINILVQQPLTLAFQTVQMIKSVTVSTDLISDRLDAYSSLLDDLISTDNTVSTTYDSSDINTLATQDLYAASSVSAMNDCVTNTTFNTRDEALEAAETVTDYFYDYMTWKERNYSSVGAVDTGSSYQQLQNQTAITASLIIDLSLSLKSQRSFILDRDMALIDFTYQYWGTTDNTAIEEAIKLNGFDNSEIFTIPRGRLVKYYS